MNLTDQQKELLRAIISGHELYGGEEFYFVDAGLDPQLTYPGGHRILVTCSRADFVHLEREGFITLVLGRAPLIRGQPTQFGINIVHRGFSASKGRIANKSPGGGTESEVNQAALAAVRSRVHCKD